MLLFHEMQKECLEAVTGNIPLEQLNPHLLCFFRTVIPGSQHTGLSAHPANQSVTTSVLETANIKLMSVVSDVWGKSGQSMIKAIMQGESDAQTLTELARGTDAAANCRSCKKTWKGASNRITGYCCSRSSPSCSSWSPRCEPLLQEIEVQMEPYQAVVELLLTHPGVQAVAAMGFVSERVWECGKQEALRGCIGYLPC
jgi:hypothetical protein